MRQVTYVYDTFVSQGGKNSSFIHVTLRIHAYATCLMPILAFKHGVKNSSNGNGSTAWHLDGWREFQKDMYQGEEKKGRHPPAFLRHMGSGLHAETDAGRSMLGKYLSDKKMSVHQYLKSEKIFEQIELLTKPPDYFW